LEKIGIVPKTRNPCLSDGIKREQRKGGKGGEGGVTQAKDFY